MSKIFESLEALGSVYPDFTNVNGKDKESDIYNKLFNSGDIILWYSDVGWRSFVTIEVNSLERTMDIDHYPLYYAYFRHYFFKNLIDIGNMFKLKERY